METKTTLNKDMEKFISFLPDIRSKIMYIILNKKYTLDDLEDFEVKINNIKLQVNEEKKVFLIKEKNFFPFFKQFDQYFFIEEEEFKNFLEKHKSSLQETFKNVEKIQDELKKETKLIKILKKIETQTVIDETMEEDFLNMNVIEYTMD